MRGLARELVACPQWRWTPGMRPLHIDGLEYLHGTHIPEASQAEVLSSRWWWPDLTDWPTVGAMLGMLPPGCFIWGPHEGRETWAIHTDTGARGRGSTLGEAVARALLASWEAS